MQPEGPPSAEPNPAFTPSTAAPTPAAARSGTPTAHATPPRYRGQDVGPGIADFVAKRHQKFEITETNTFEIVVGSEAS